MQLGMGTMCPTGMNIDEECKTLGWRPFRPVCEYVTCCACSPLLAAGVVLQEVVGSQVGAGSAVDDLCLVLHTFGCFCVGSLLSFCCGKARLLDVCLPAR